MTTQANVTSAEVSRDGVDYGWLWLATDDYFYVLNRYPSQSALYRVLGYAKDDYGKTRVYGCSELGAVQADPTGFSHRDNIYETLYYDGTLVYHRGPHVQIEYVVAGGQHGADYMANEWCSRDFPAGINKWFTTPDSNTRINATKSAIKRVVFEDTVALHWDNSESSDQLFYISNWFAGCVSLESIEGFEYISTPYTETMAGMFRGCALIEELDLSSFSTSACTDFTGMFDGCDSLTKITFGENWTQRGAAEGKRATFNLSMACEETGQVYAQGDVIPDGAGTYVTTRTSIKKTQVLFGQAGAVADTAPEAFQCEYTGEAIVPSLALEYGDMELVDGEDYVVSYSDNIEDGWAVANISGIGEFYGHMNVKFQIVDTGAYAFLFDNGTLCLKAHHARPSSTVASATVGVAHTYRWFDAATDDPGIDVPWADAATQVKRIVVDPSFAAFRPVSMERWFSGCTQLAEVEGLGNVDTSAVSSMAGLFEGCTALTELDLSGLGTHGVSDFSNFAQGCTALESLNLANLDLSAAIDAEGFTGGCARLLSVKTGSGWRNAPGGLSFPDEYFQVAPTYKKHAAGKPLPSGAGEYRLAEMPMQSAKIVMPKSSYDCTGKAIRPKPTVTVGDVKLVEGVDYTLKYENNLYPGTAKVSVLGKGVFSGGLVVKFGIRSLISQAGDRVTYKDKIATYTLKVTKVAKRDGHVAKANVTITKVTVHKSSVAKLSLPTTCTIGGVKVTVTAVGKKLTGSFRNVRTVNVGSTVTSIGSSAFSKAPKVTKLVVKTSRLKSARNCLKGSKVARVNVTATLTKAKQTSYKKWFTSSSGKSGVRYSYK
ncbi:MAG: leucine-rich repeat protein [Coriobacteriia bacterium]|nr:leucine-rich repeat protein [Coriobacteriia bacterium]